MKFFRSLALLSSVLLLLAGIVEILYEGFGVDYRTSVSEMHCRGNLEDNYPTLSKKFCPSSKGTDGEYVVFEQSEPSGIEIYVLACDRNLFHEDRSTLFFRRLFANVLLSDGRVYRWEGSDLLYRSAVEAAKRDANNRLVHEFFRDAKNKEKVLSVR